MRITAHVGFDHPNGQRIRAGLTFVEQPADFDVTAEQYAAIVADPAIIVTKAHGKAKADAPAVADPKPKTPSQMNTAELTALAAERGIDVSGAKTKKDMRALIAHAGPVTHRGQGQTAAEQEAADERK